jgi:hypothetical protein
MFEETYSVTTDANPTQGGAVDSDPPDCTVGTCDPGTQVELTATSNEGYEFVGWSGDVSGSENPTSLVLDANKNVVANFLIRCDSCTPHAFVPLVVR